MREVQQIKSKKLNQFIKSAKQHYQNAVIFKTIPVQNSVKFQILIGI